MPEEITSARVAFGNTQEETPQQGEIHEGRKKL
jgi:hypothetical protein